MYLDIGGEYGATQTYYSTGVIRPASDAEMDVHLGSEVEKAVRNHRNGHSKKTVLTDSSDSIDGFERT
jgi:transposase-like protein